jgi:hypothetical protein
MFQGETFECLCFRLDFWWNIQVFMAIKNPCISEGAVEVFYNCGSDSIFGGVKVKPI